MERERRRGGVPGEVPGVLLAGLIGQVALLAALSAAVGVSELGWLVGLSCATITFVALMEALPRRDSASLGPADRVTLMRGTLVGGVAALAVSSSSQPEPVATLVALATIALILDAVDGWVARRTRTVSALGARFDMEVDAFLILVLSGYVAQSMGLWVLALGAARYAYVAAGWMMPWLRCAVPFRYWRKVVAATVGVVLAVAAADVLPRPVTVTALLVALVLLGESFGRDVVWLWQHQDRRENSRAGLRTPQRVAP